MTEIDVNPNVLFDVIRDIISISKPKEITDTLEYEKKREDIELQLWDFYYNKHEEWMEYKKQSKKSKHSIGKYNNINIREIMKIGKFLLSPPHKLPGSNYYHSSELYQECGDISKNDRKRIMQILFEEIGPHHWGINKIFTLNIYPNHVTDGTIDRLYFNELYKKNPLISLISKKSGIFQLNQVSFSSSQWR